MKKRQYEQFKRVIAMILCMVMLLTNSPLAMISYAEGDDAADTYTIKVTTVGGGVVDAPQGDVVVAANSAQTVSWSFATDYKYADVTVKVGENTLTQDTDYTLAENKCSLTIPADKVAAGSTVNVVVTSVPTFYNIVVSGDDGVTGITENAKVYVDAANVVTWSIAEEYEYDGVEVKVGENTLTQGTDYTLAENSGSYTLTILAEKVAGGSTVNVAVKSKPIHYYNIVVSGDSITDITGNAQVRVDAANVVTWRMDDGYDLDSVTVKVGENALTQDSDYTLTESNGSCTLTIAADKITVGSTVNVVVTTKAYYNITTTKSGDYINVSDPPVKAYVGDSCAITWTIADGYIYDGVTVKTVNSEGTETNLTAGGETPDYTLAGDYGSYTLTILANKVAVNQTVTVVIAATPITYAATLSVDTDGTSANAQEETDELYFVAKPTASVTLSEGQEGPAGASFVYSYTWQYSTDGNNWTNGEIGYNSETYNPFLGSRVEALTDENNATVGQALIIPLPAGADRRAALDSYKIRCFVKADLVNSYSDSIASSEMGSTPSEITIDEALTTCTLVSLNRHEDSLTAPTVREDGSDTQLIFKVEPVLSNAPVDSAVTYTYAWTVEATWIYIKRSYTQYIAWNSTGLPVRITQYLPLIIIKNI